jgi:hypothetical protein
VLDWISSTILAITAFVPAWLVAEDSPNFMLIRAMFGLLLIVFVVGIIAARPFRSLVSRAVKGASRSIARKA